PSSARSEPAFEPYSAWTVNSFPPSVQSWRLSLPVNESKLTVTRVVAASLATVRGGKYLGGSHRVRDAPVLRVEDDLLRAADADRRAPVAVGIAHQDPA